MFDRSKLESLRDVSATRIGDTLSYGFPQTVLVGDLCLVRVIFYLKPFNFNDFSLNLTKYCFLTAIFV